MVNPLPQGISHEGQGASRDTAESMLSLYRLKVDQVTEESTDITMADDKIQVHSTSTVSISAEG